MCLFHRMPSSTLFHFLVVITLFTSVLADNNYYNKCPVPKEDFGLSTFLPMLHPKTFYDGPPSISQAKARTTNPTPSEKDLRYYSFYAILTMCPDSPEKETCDAPTCPNFSEDVTYYKILNDLVSHTLGIVAVVPDRKEIIVSFRGAMKPVNWISDFAAVQIPQKTPDGDTVLIHPGFYYSTLRLYPKVLEELTALLEKHRTYTVVLTGASMGGAMASVTLFLLKSKDEFNWVKYVLVTYGQPRTGDKAYADYMNHLGVPMARVVGGKDIVPHVPPTTLASSMLPYNYVHHMREVWINGTDIIKYCSTKMYEDPTCSTSKGPCYTPTDHIHYFDNDHGWCNSATNITGGDVLTPLVGALNPR